MEYILLKAEYDLHVNERNPSYEHPTQPIPPIPNLRGVYSKQNAYTITNSGFVTFIFDGTNTPTAGGGFFGTTTGNFMLINEPLIKLLSV